MASGFQSVVENQVDELSVPGYMQTDHIPRRASLNESNLVTIQWRVLNTPRLIHAGPRPLYTISDKRYYLLLRS